MIQKGPPVRTKGKVKMDVKDKIEPVLERRLRRASSRTMHLNDESGLNEGISRLPFGASFAQLHSLILFKFSWNDL